jgi:hypothetical protein
LINTFGISISSLSSSADYGDGARLRARIKTDGASGTPLAFILSGMVTHFIEMRRHLENSWRTCIDTSLASLAFLFTDNDLVNDGRSVGGHI